MEQTNFFLLLRHTKVSFRLSAARHVETVIVGPDQWTYRWIACRKVCVSSKGGRIGYDLRQMHLHLNIILVMIVFTQLLAQITRNNNFDSIQAEKQRTD